ncbi:ABC transporter substrate-binding protein [Candidatus Woesearchaeota archaeon]|nr:ABC transporter substrate-binding protein [Candidatus Woesearchaeota archaeon]
MNKNIIALIMITVFLVGCTPTGKIVREAPKEPIEIGVITPLTSKGSYWGLQVRDGLNMAMQEINNKGGVNDRKIKLIYEDTQCDPKISATATHKLINVDGVKILIGEVCSTATLAAAPIAEQNKVIFFVPISSSSEITQAGDYVFRNRESSAFSGELLAEFVHDELGIKEVSVLYINSETGISYGDAFKERLEQLGGEILTDEGYEKREKNFRTSLLKIKKAEPEALYIPGFYEDIGLIIKQTNELGIDIQFLSTSAFQADEIFEIAGDSVEGTIYTYPYFDAQSPDSKIKDFVNNYKERYGEEPEFSAASSYDALYILTLTMDKCDEDTDCVKNELYNLKEYPGVTGTTSFDENGDVIKPIAIKTVRNGEFVLY